VIGGAVLRLPFAPLVCERKRAMLSAPGAPLRTPVFTNRPRGKGRFDDRGHVGHDGMRRPAGAAGLRVAIPDYRFPVGPRAMRRRTVLGCAAGVVLWGLSPLAAQVPVKVHRIGYLTMRASLADFDRAFLESLAALGYVDGRTIAIDFRFADSDLERAERMVGELIALKPDVLVVGGPASRVAARATSTIPIVMTAVADPVGQGLVASLRHPGGNLTGVTLQSTELAQKRLQILRDIVPSISRVALLGMRSGTVGDPTRRDGTSPLVAEVERAAGLAGVALVSRLVREAGELPEAFMHFRRARSQALIVQVAPVTYDNRRTILALAAEQRLPALYETRNYVDDGGLMSYGPDLIEVNRRAATYVDRILRGAKPGELAVDQPGRFELVVNLRTAAALGIAVPQALLMRADDVIR